MGVIVVCVYRPPSGNHKIFFSNMEKLLGRICNGDTSVFICGDFNINLVEKKQQTKNPLWKQTYQTIGLL